MRGLCACGCIRSLKVVASEGSIDYLLGFPSIMLLAFAPPCLSPLSRSGFEFFRLMKCILEREGFSWGGCSGDFLFIKAKVWMRYSAISRALSTAAFKAYKRKGFSKWRADWCLPHLKGWYCNSYSRNAEGNFLLLPSKEIGQKNHQPGQVWHSNYHHHTHFCSRIG